MPDFLLQVQFCDYGLSLPMNRSFPRRKLIVLVTFFLTLFSVFRKEIYLIISFRLEAGNSSNTFLAFGFSLRAFINLGCASMVLSDGSNTRVISKISPTRFGEFFNIVVFTYNLHFPLYLTRVCTYFFSLTVP